MKKEIITDTSKKGLPYTVEVREGTGVEAFADWYNNSKNYISEHLLKSGAILFQGVQIASVHDFDRLTELISKKFRNYVDGSYPRKKLAGHTYVSTEYDANYRITMHNELSYSVKWPTLLFFGCIIPAAEGGETPLVDSRRILDRMNPDLLREFEVKNIRYVRNLHAGAGFGPSWQETFETKDKKVVEKYCEAIDIRYQWKDNDHLKLIHTRPSVRRHPVTGEKVWFNQVDQFHPSHFPQEIYETLILMADGNGENLPLYVSFGDGTPITEDIVHEVQQTIDEGIVERPWMQGDFVVIDNMLVAHGRAPYKGKRQIVVSMEADEIYTQTHTG